MIDASRSTAECIASVTIATDPVIAPAASLSTISTVFDAIETAAARLLARVLRARWALAPTAMSLIVPLPARPGRLLQAGDQRPGRPAAVAHRVLLGVGELGH